MGKSPRVTQLSLRIRRVLVEPDASLVGYLRPSIRAHERGDNDDEQESRWTRGTRGDRKQRAGDGRLGDS